MWKTTMIWTTYPTEFADLTSEPAVDLNVQTQQKINEFVNAGKTDGNLVNSNEPAPSGQTFVRYFVDETSANEYKTFFDNFFASKSYGVPTIIVEQVS